MDNSSHYYCVSRQSHAKGFSLVEVMISLAILMMVLFIGNLAYRTYSVYWEKELGDFDKQVSELQGIANLHSVIRNIKPMVLRGGEAGGYVYFEGGDSLIRAIANEAMSDSGAAAAFEVTVVNKNSSEVEIQYREFPIVNSPLLNEDQIGRLGSPVVLLSGVEDVRFEYFGWASYDEFAAFERSEPSVQLSDKLWFGLYSGKDTLISPDAVKLRIKKDGKWSELQIPLTHFLHEDLLQFVGVEF